MKSIRPFISIVIPTRDRPELVKYSLYYLTQQSFKNFEVIVVDNFINASCKNEFDVYQNDQRFKYFQPETPLAMSDNWEYAIAKARGEYVTVISEKYLFRNDALEVLNQILNTKPADLVTWWNETYLITKKQKGDYSGRYVPQFKPETAQYFSPLEELSKRLSFKRTPYSRNLGPEECLGKIYSGCYHRSLIQKIKDKYGRVFQPLMPDITSMTAALSLMPTCLDLRQPLMFVCASPEISNGFQTITNTKNFKAYYSDYNQDNYARGVLPYQELDMALSNYIAYDFKYFQSLSDNECFKKIKINESNLLVRIKEDIDKIITWESEDEKYHALRSWQELVAKCDTEEQIYIVKQLESEESIQPSSHEIHFAGGEDIGTYQEMLSAKRRAKLNWLDNKVFRIKDEHINYNSIAEAMDYFTEYYKESMKLLKLIAE